MRLSRAVFINHIDRENANFDTAMAAAARPLRLAPGRRRPSPSAPAADFKGVIDIIRMKARYFDESGKRARRRDPRRVRAGCAGLARDKLCDLVAEADDELMMKYLDGRGAADTRGAGKPAGQGHRAGAHHPRLRGLHDHHARRGQASWKTSAPTSRTRRSHGAYPHGRRRGRSHIDETQAPRRLRLQDDRPTRSSDA